MNKFEKNDVFFKKKIKNYNIIIETESALSVSIDLKVEKTWFVN